GLAGRHVGGPVVTLVTLHELHGPLSRDGVRHAATVPGGSGSAGPQLLAPSIGAGQGTGCDSVPRRQDRQREDAGKDEENHHGRNSRFARMLPPVAEKTLFLDFPPRGCEAEAVTAVADPPHARTDPQADTRPEPDAPPLRSVAALLHPGLS